MSDPKPMDPERLAALRELAASFPVGAAGGFLVDGLIDLLADRDCQEQRADKAERERDDARADLVREVAESKRLADVLGGEEVGHDVLSPDQWMALLAGPGSAIDRLIAFDRAYASHYRIAALIKTAEDEAAAMRTEVARLRARVRVEAEDVERLGLTRVHVEAWLAASTDWKRIDDGSHEPGSIWRRKDYPIVCPGWGLLMAVHTIAGDRLGGAIDILDEMAAMPEVG